MDYDVIVAGAGYGVTCAALLAIEGKRVLLVDKNPSAGGKVMTVRRGGYGYELWPIAGGPSEDSLFHKLAEVLGEDPDDLIIQPDIAGEYRYIRADGSVAIAEFSARPSLHPEVAAGLPEAFGATDEDMGPLMDFVNYVLTVDVDAHKELETEDLLSGTRRFGMAPTSRRTCSCRSASRSRRRSTASRCRRRSSRSGRWPSPEGDGTAAAGTAASPSSPPPRSPRAAAPSS